MNTIEEAPGLRRRARKHGEAWYWIATAVSRQAKNYPTQAVRLHYPTADERAAACRILTAQLKEWLAFNDRGHKTDFDGTIRGLINRYQTIPESPYFRIQENTRRDYDQRLRVLSKVVGASDVDGLTLVDFQSWYRRFRKPRSEGGRERIRKAHGLMTMLRTIFKFGVAMRYTGCPETLEVLDAIEFETPGKRSQAITFEQAEKIVAGALAAGRPSIALGQALQFELTLRQVDVIGKWERAKPGEGGIVFRGKRWGGGLLWSNVSDDLTLSKTTTKTAAVGEWMLSEYPLVMKALSAFPAEKRIGPMIISESHGRPYGSLLYAREWRVFADAAGVPKDVWNRDSRAGGITEAWDANASERDIQRLATHSDPAMTRRYARNSLASTNRVAEFRRKAREQRRNRT